MTPSSTAQVYRAALALALGAAVSLGLARFSYAMLLPPMQADWGWSYFTAGAMNTVNAAGYLVGALWAPRWLARHDARRVMLVGMATAAALLALHALAQSDAAMFILRAATGVASAATFVSGGLLAARLGSQAQASMNVSPDKTLSTASNRTSSLVLGIYYGGTGLGIVASAWMVPWAVASAPAQPGWRAAWVGLGLLAAVASVVSCLGSRSLLRVSLAHQASSDFDWRPMRFGLLGYLMFGLGYIGYMTFIITLLRQRGMDDTTTVVFYVSLGVAVMVSPWLWAGLLQRHRGGVPMAVLNGLLAVATLLPVLSVHPLVVFASGALFGSVFLSVVASTTAMVRHNVEAAAWSRGIAAFTIVFAAGQIVGPTLVGWVADGPGGLQRGFLISAGLLALGSWLASMQRARAP